MGRFFITSSLVILAIFGLIGFAGLNSEVGAAPEKSYTCGDVNDDGSINVLDITFLISFLYKGGPAPGLLRIADVNNSGVVNLLDITYLLNFLYKGGPDPDCPSDPGGPTGTKVWDSGCKTFLGDRGTDSIPTDQECIVYSYDGESVLQFTHVNAGFNCCPSAVIGEIVIDGNVIMIFEDENFDTLGPCACLCLFDVEYEITNLEPGEYTFEVYGLYNYEGDDPLEFTVNLISEPSGSYCVYRDHYPWGFDYGPWGTITGTFGCKDGSMNKGDTAHNQDCIEYSYDGEDVLQLTHVNAGFNCCPIIQAYITVQDNVITITENETFDVGPCYCLCLFDVYYEISGLPPGEYTIKVNGLYLDEGDEPLELIVDLATTPSGEYCMYRGHYPWYDW